MPFLNSSRACKEQNVVILLNAFIYLLVVLLEFLLAHIFSHPTPPQHPTTFPKPKELLVQISPSKL